MRTFHSYNSSDFYSEDAVACTLNHFDSSKNTKQKLIEKFKKKPIAYVAEEEVRLLE